MKVGNINGVFFRGNSVEKQTNSASIIHPQIKELPNVTPDFGVNIPQKYSFLGTHKLANGLELYSYKLANGYRVSIVPMEGSPAVVKNYVNVGSMNETEDIKGISHFLEHMAFNGTNGENGHIKLEVGDSFKKIDEIGGWTNASTNYAITDYVNSAPLLKQGDLEKQIKIIASMTEDLKLSQAMIDKEKGPVCSEINMIMDDPQTIAFDQMLRTLFNIQNSADEMVGGSVKHIKNLTRKDIVDYYNKYYTPDNMNLVITGDVNPNEVMHIVSSNFNSHKMTQGKKFEERLTPINNVVRKDFICDKANSTELILGFAGPKNKDTREKILCELAALYLQSPEINLNKELKKLNTNIQIGGEKISTNPNNPRLNYISTSISEENSEKALKIIFDKISNIKAPKNLQTLKEKLLKLSGDAFEYSLNVNDIIGRAVLDNDIEFVTDYEKILNTITPEDIEQTIKKYFNINKAAVVMVHPQQEISFKGKTERKPINTNKISNYRLSNNYNAAFYETNKNDAICQINLKTNIPYHKKAGVVEVLNKMYSMGTATKTEDKLKLIKNNNNIELSVNAYADGISTYSNCGIKNKQLMLDLTKELLYNPRFTEQNLEMAKYMVKDRLSRQQNSSYNLYRNNELNKYEFSDKEILNTIDSITLEDVKDCHNYLLSNSMGTVCANSLIKDDILKMKLSPVLTQKIQTLEVFKPNTTPKVLKTENKNSQADIMQLYRYKLDGTLKEIAVTNILNSILSNSEIGLFNVLREKQHLAYSVFSSIERNGDCGELSCNILTTTDNKDIGEISYDNVQKSINGFHERINAVKNGEYSEKDLENAKLALKASLLNNEGTQEKLNIITESLNSKYGITYHNKLYNIIDSITKEDITKMADKIFSNPPIYSIVATKDTLDYNKEYLENLENNN